LRKVYSNSSVRNTAPQLWELSGVVETPHKNYHEESRKYIFVSVYGFCSTEIEHLQPTKCIICGRAYDPNPAWELTAMPRLLAGFKGVASQEWRGRRKTEGRERGGSKGV